MTLATADSLGLGVVNYADMMDKFLAWQKGAYTVDGYFGSGRTVRTALKNYESGMLPLESGSAEENFNGNGSLMRIYPAVIYNIQLNNLQDTTIMDNIGKLTHAHPISIIACGVYGFIVRDIMQNKSNSSENVANAVGLALQHYGTKYPEHIATFDRLSKPNFKDIKEENIGSSGYVMDTLEAAVWCYLNTDNFEDCVLKTVNLGGDTDSTASVAGSLAGIAYGKKSIPKDWMEGLRGQDQLNGIFEKFYNTIENINSAEKA